MTKSIKLFAWDFHGTLEQGTEVGFFEILKDLAKEINYPAKIKLAEVRELFGASVLDYLKHFFPKLSNNEIVNLRDKIRTRQNRKHLQKYIKPAPYAEVVLAKIREEDHLNIIVSTSSEYHISHFLKVVGLDKKFNKVFGIDRHALDKEFDIAKEKSKVIKGFAKKHKIPAKNIIVIGDRKGEIEAGILLGAKTYQYIQPEMSHIATRADFKIYDLREILREI